MYIMILIIPRETIMLRQRPPSLYMVGSGSGWSSCICITTIHLSCTKEEFVSSETRQPLQTWPPSSPNVKNGLLTPRCFLTFSISFFSFATQTNVLLCSQSSSLISCKTLLILDVFSLLSVSTQMGDHQLKVC